MNNLKTIWHQHNNLEPNARAAFYDAFIWSAIKFRFGLRYHTKPYAISLHVVGTSFEPVTLSAFAFNALQVILLHTTDTKHVTKRIITELEFGDVRIQTRLIDRADPQELYKAVQISLETIPKNSSIAFELTSGTKAMVAALAFQANALHTTGRNVDVYYINNPRWDTTARRPEPGFEELIKLEMPA